MTLQEEKDTILTDAKQNNMEYNAPNSNFFLPSAPIPGGQALVSGPQAPFMPIPGGQPTINGPLPPFAPFPPSKANASRPLRHIPLVRKALKGLTVVQLVLGVVILVFGSSCLGVGQRMLHGWDGRGAGCLLGTGTWVGVLSITTGSLGVAAVFLRSFPRGPSRCLLVSYFSLCIISAIANAILLGLSVIWSAKAGQYVHSYYSSSLMEGSLALNVFLVGVSFAVLVLCVVSSSFICYLWSCCCDHKTAAHPQSSVSYIPPPAVQMQQTEPNQQYVLVPLSAIQRREDGRVIVGGNPK